MTHVTCRLTAKNRDQLRNPALGNRVCVILYGMWVPVAVWQVRLRTAISVYFTVYFTLYSDMHTVLLMCVTGTGRPPTIVDQSSGEMSYKVSEKVELVCVASGDPPPSYVTLQSLQPVSYASNAFYLIMYAKLRINRARTKVFLLRVRW